MLFGAQGAPLLGDKFSRFAIPLDNPKGVGAEIDADGVLSG